MKKSFFVKQDQGGGNIVLGFRVAMLATSTMESFDLPLRPVSDTYLDRLTEIGKDLVRTLAGIPGIDKITVNLYEVRLSLSSAFDWDRDLGPGITANLRAVFVRNGEMDLRQKHKRKKEFLPENCTGPSHIVM